MAVQATTIGGAADAGDERQRPLDHPDDLAHRDEVGGFSGIDDLASGDDELLLQKVAVKYQGRIGFLKQREAIVYTHAKRNLKEFLQQRRRWASKSTKYKDKKVVALAVSIWLFNVSIVTNALLGFYDVRFFQLFLIQFILKTI